MRAYPRAFRARYHDEIVDAFVEGLADARHDGRLAAVRYWIVATIDLLGSAARIHSTRIRALQSPHVGAVRGEAEHRIDTIVRDTRLAVRRMGKSPGFAFIVVLTIAIGIGATTAIFSVVNGVVLEQLPYPDADRLVTVNETNEAAMGVATPSYVAWRDGTRAFEQLAGMSSAALNVALPGEEPVQLKGAAVSANYLRTLRVYPVLGRDFAPGEDAIGMRRTLILSHAVWQQQFRSDARAIGRTVFVSELAYTVIGVMPASFRTPFGPSDFLTQRFIPLSELTNLALSWTVIGRLAPGVDVARAASDIGRLAQLTAQRFPQRGPWHSGVIALHDAVVGSARSTLFMLFAAVAVVMLVACANVTSLLLARSTAEAHEVALRVTLGATTSRIARQLITETTALAVCGGVAGLGLAAALTHAFSGLAPANLPRLESVRIDGRVLVFTALLTFAVSLVWSIVPVLHFRHADLQRSIKLAGEARVERWSHRGVRAIVAVESSFVLVLLIAAALLVQSYRRLTRLELGFDPTDRIAVTISLPKSRYPDEPRVAAFFSDLSTRVSALPGVLRVGVASTLPPGNSFWNYLFFQDHPSAPDAKDTPLVDFDVASADYFAAAGTRVVRGRAFTAADADQSAGPTPVAIISESAARAFFPGIDPIGHRVNFDPSKRWIEIVGVVADARFGGVAATAKPHIYLPTLHVGLPWHIGQRQVVVHTSGGQALIKEIRAATRAIDPLQPITSIEPLDAAVVRSIGQPRFNTALLVAFGAVVLILGAVGVYGSVSYAVTQRRQEFGIRAALGAQRSRLVREVTLTGLAPVGAGIVVGLGGFLMVSRVVSGFLYELRAIDPLTMAGASVFLLCTALAACIPAARRAAGTDPLSSLRGID